MNGVLTSVRTFRKGTWVTDQNLCAWRSTTPQPGNPRRPRAAGGLPSRLSLIGNADDARDVAQDALSLRFGTDRFDPARPLLPWLLRITSNLASNRRRGMARFQSCD